MGKYAWRNIAIPVKNQNPSGTNVLVLFLKELEDCWQLALETLDRI
jgi:hypothetical protein